MRSFNHFDVLAPLYKRISRPKNTIISKDYFYLSRESIVLDAGGGNGRVSQIFSELCKQVIVVDLSFKMLSAAKNKNKLQLVCANIESLPFQTELFDIVIMVDAFHHIKNQDGVTREIWRAVKKGGKIFIQEPDINRLRIKAVALLEKILFMKSIFQYGEKILNMFEETNIIKELFYDKWNYIIIITKI